jgi:hypothetical protein
MLARSPWHAGCSMLLMMHAIVTTMAEQVRAAGSGALELMPIAAGMSIVAFVFLVAQTLLFFEELWWRP